MFPGDPGLTEEEVKILLQVCNAGNTSCVNVTCDYPFLNVLWNHPDVTTFYIL